MINRVEFAFGSHPDDEFVLMEVNDGKPKVLSKGTKESMTEKKNKLEADQAKLIKKFVVRKSSNIWA